MGYAHFFCNFVQQTEPNITWMFVRNRYSYTLYQMKIDSVLTLADRHVARTTKLSLKFGVSDRLELVRVGQRKIALQQQA